MDESEIEVMKLSLTDHFAPRAYVRLAMVWPFDHTKEAEAAERIRTGLHCLFIRYPYLAGYLAMSLDGEGIDTRLDAMEIHYPNTIHAVSKPQFVIKHPNKDEFPYTYDELHAEGMPGNKLLNHLLTTVPHVPDLGTPQPVVSVTANFFEGGLILHLAFLHVIGDGTGMNLLLREWCDFVRDGTTPQTIKRRSLPGRHTILQPKKRRNGTRNEFPTGYAMVDPAEGPTGINSVKHLGLPHPVSARVFTFSHERLHGLKDALNHVLRTAGYQFWISTNDCINAMLWLYVTRARILDIRETRTTYFMPVDVREKRFELGNLEDYSGNATILAQVTCHVEDFLEPPGHESEDGLPNNAEHAPDTPMLEMMRDTIARDFTKVTVKEHKDFGILAHLVQLLRQSVNNVDAPYIQERLSFMLTALPKCHLVRWNFHNYFGPDFFCTSWINFGADTKWAIPGTLSEYPTFLRKPYVPDDGSSVVLPRRKDVPHAEDKTRTVKPPYEIWVQLREDHLRNLCEADSLGGWADRIA
ncbi:MAG: hypothetical protein M1821_008060 [Bathelium mastoideum]|nr:MAG: hypothetical protein M1821_008060 [Bathelium mastoideum]KAI9693104.1 MAG: hypothetical protein M1822_005099 [Bathelium mastoideum]